LRSIAQRCCRIIVWKNQHGTSAAKMKIRSRQSEDYIQSGTSLPAAGRSEDLRQADLKKKKRE